VRADREEEEAVEAEPEEPADEGCFFGKVFEIRIGVSYFTNEKLFDAEVVILGFSNKIITSINLRIMRDNSKVNLNN